MIQILHSVSNMDRAGVETMLMNYYRHMDREKVQFNFLCNKTKPGAYDDEIISLGGKIYRTPSLNPAKYPQYLRYMRQLFCEHPEYRIIEAHNGPLGLYALYAAERCGIPNRIFHAHGTDISFDFKWPLKKLCKSRLPHHCNLNWACGADAARHYFGDKTVSAGNYRIVPNAVDTGRFAFSESSRQRIRKKYGLGSKVVIGHVGRFVAVKNHGFLIDVFQRLHKAQPDSALVLLGDGELQRAMEQKARQTGLERHILFMGNVSNADEWYQAMDAFVMPSSNEGLPVVGVEAQAASLPCILSENITKEVVISDRVIFVALEKAPEEWAKIILRAVQKNKREDMAKQIASAGYDIRVEAEKLQNQYIMLAKDSAK